MGLPGRLLLALCVVLAACKHNEPARHLDFEAIKISSDAKLRTDTVGDGRFTDTSSFVLVDARNTASTGAYVTIGGELTDQSGAEVGQLRGQSIWIPPGESRTFALVDMERKPRPSATSARIKVRGALVPNTPPPARIEELRSFDDRGKTVVQAYLVNDAVRAGTIMVLGSFHDADGKPMTRPFQMVRLEGNTRQTVQFVGPQGSVKGAIFVGDVVY